MTLIEGFGDEVTLLLAATFFVVLLYLVWISTHVPNRPLLYLQLTGGNQTFSNSDLQHLSGLDVSQSELNEGSYNSSSIPGTFNGGETSVNNNGGGGGNGTSSSSNESASAEDELRNEIAEGTSSGSNNSILSSQTRATSVAHSTINSFRSFVGQVHQSALSTLRRRNTSIAATGNATESSPANSVPTEQTQTSAQASSSDNLSNAPYSSTQFSLSSLNLELPQTLRDQQADCYFIKLKFLNDLQCEVEVHPSEKLSDFKTRIFRDVIAAGGQVRLIFAGGLLRDESLSLVESGVLSSCVIHCHILAQNASGSNGAGASNDVSTGRLDNFNSDNIDLSNLMFLLFAIFLSVLWYLRFSYRSLFTRPTTFTLIAITLLFLLAIYASFIL